MRCSEVGDTAILKIDNNLHCVKICLLCELEIGSVGNGSFWVRASCKLVYVCVLLFIVFHLLSMCVFLSLAWAARAVIWYILGAVWIQCIPVWKVGSMCYILTQNDKIAPYVSKQIYFVQLTLLILLHFRFKRDHAHSIVHSCCWCAFFFLLTISYLHSDSNQLWNVQIYTHETY